MSKSLLVLLAFLGVAFADNSWWKVRQIKSGYEVRIFKTNSKQPLIAMFDEATEDNIIVVVKNEQFAIPKADVDRVDARPPRTGLKGTKETRTSVKDPTPLPRTAEERAGPSSSVTTTYGIGSRPDFETVYRRMPAAPPETK